MPDSRRTNRRTVCRRAGSLVVALTGLATISGSASAYSERERTDEATTGRGGRSIVPARSHEESTPDHEGSGADGLEFYRGVVDRIVDDRFVVILLEEDGEVVDELVEPREELPPLAESDRVIVVLADGELRSVIPLSNGE